MAPTYCYSVEPGAIGAYKALLLVNTLTQLGKVKPDKIYLATEQAEQRGAIDSLRTRGVRFGAAKCDFQLNPNTVAVAPGELLEYNDDQLNEHGFLKAAKHAQTTAQLEVVNKFIAAERQRAFNNRIFWDYRYARCPELGSGVGSRGEFLELKSKLIQSEVERLGPRTVLDIGCGDIEVCRHLRVEKYTGVDVSGEAVRIARSKRPDWTFIEGDALTANLEPADLVLCFDVLIHQPSREAYVHLCKKLAELTRRVLLIAGIDSPEQSANILFYYEPLSTTLARLGGQIEPVGRYREVTVFRWTPF